jgi:hypothetical protein
MAFGDNMVVNGDFEQVLSNGWTEESFGSDWNIDRDTDYDADADYEACVQNLTSWGPTTIHQTVSISGTDIHFSALAKLHPWGGSSDEWSVATVILYYLDSSAGVLGETRIYRSSGSCFDWFDSPTVHLIQGATGWQNYSFDVADELTNLSGVNPADVAGIMVEVGARISGSC